MFFFRDIIWENIYRDKNYLIIKKLLRFIEMIKRVQLHFSLNE